MRIIISRSWTPTAADIAYLGDTTVTPTAPRVETISTPIRATSIPAAWAQPYVAPKGGAK